MRYLRELHSELVGAMRLAYVHQRGLRNAAIFQTRVQNVVLMRLLGREEGLPRIACHLFGENPGFEHYREIPEAQVERHALVGKKDIRFQTVNQTLWQPVQCRRRMVTVAST